MRGTKLAPRFEVRPHQCLAQGSVTVPILLATLLVTQAKTPLVLLSTWAHTLHLHQFQFHHIKCCLRHSPGLAAALTEL